MQFNIEEKCSNNDWRNTLQILLSLKSKFDILLFHEINLQQNWKGFMSVYKTLYMQNVT
jgi:hypothetical protein